MQVAILLASVGGASDDMLVQVTPFDGGMKMKLQEFVSETLKEIIGGVKDAQSFAEGNGAKISISPHKGYRPIKEVEFDVAVTSTDAKESQAGAGIFVAAIGLGAKGKSDTLNSCISRVKFSVPIVLPVQGTT